ncbi:OmpA family protein [Idiomarina loihiensis]|jgi:outer membrane protein OmpA-like peptidoglycan-associated protein|uniref:Outer membrane protein and related peptidoglycan-associated (Lipo)proteins n=2 Tax=Idiomarina TaxID=135575 RepID=Q5QU88_IDILO|nr:MULTISPECIES: OmpA family protein [Idiomarina]NWO03044.1 OmpA family protein [Idiomarinaceae bacterium]AAV82403.1 Outer membrane protein and related peptidoglycan-associated (lipo)proteins [Idiomarina loihiensis L2TR]AGM36437.1 Outer membrane protein-related peptidoglycan-associated (lipo)protein [Idiomarina loihiensis GSL 199]MRJ44213.1 OmpA family protein [Idiomarina loihiensis]UTW33665.1 OmpA family protein [Idiomarina loihiensis]
MKKLVLTMMFSSLALVGCENMSNTQKGASIGAVTGALLGKGTGDHDKSRYVWGAAVGALAGGAIGSYMDKQEEEFREELADSGVKVIRDGDNLRLQLPSNITFATGSANISQSFNPVLDDVARVLKKYEKTTMLIEGHTDSTGSAEYNQQLSLNRANAVRNNLVGNGVDSRRVTTEGYGESMPVADNDTESGRQLNRRVELRIVPNTQ